MDYGIGFILGALAIGFLWALRELERREVFDSLAEELEKVRALDRRHYEMFVHLRNGMEEVRIDLGGKGSLPAPAEHAGQHLAARVTASLKGVLGSSGSDGPYFSGRGQ